MAALAEFHPDRSSWPAGPWDSESDREDFVHAGLSCFVQRNRMGAWYGYVGVPKDHPFYGKDYDDVEPYPDVHGGLTYADRCNEHLCHIPQEGMPSDVWWLGFDTAHFMDMDIVPGMLQFDEVRSLLPGTYKDLAYVTVETQRLAEQLAEER